MERYTVTRIALAVMVISMVTTGCAFKVVKHAPNDADRIAELNDQLSNMQHLTDAKDAEAERLRQAKNELEKRLAQEIKDQQVSVDVDQRGIIITFVAEVLFNSGKDDLLEDAMPTLDKVAKVLNKNVKSQPIGIEGHTDNQPIQYSGWRSNWELSTARATSVLHYLVDERGLAPTRVSATGYGEYHPITSNDTTEGQRRNRRVEIVVLPEALAKKVTQPLAATSGEEIWSK